MIWVSQFFHNLSQKYKEASKIPFFAPKITENGRFRVQKNGTSDAQIQKRTPLFVANYP